jgi:uncharacterized membrane protein
VDEKIEEEFLLQHQSNTVMFGKIILVEVFVMNFIDTIFELDEYYLGDHISKVYYCAGFTVII